jgi:NADH-ubiquinone oxidoreductase chain 5
MVYKALLFLGAGAVIHAVSDNQDFRKYGGLRAFLPLTYSVMLIASLSLVAFPYMTGFYSKDFILESAYGQFYFSSIVVYFIASIGAIFTTLYSVKVLYLTFLANPLGSINNYKNAHEGDIYLSLPLIILAFFSIFFGYISKDLFIGLGSAFFADNSIFIHPYHEIMIETEFAVPLIFKLLPFFSTIFFSVLALTVSEFLPNLIMYFKYTRFGYNVYSFFNQRFFIELFYNKYITGTVLYLGGQTTKILDKGTIELIGPFGLEKGLLHLGKNISYLDTGVITSYALYILMGLIFYIMIPYLYYIDNSLLLVILYGLLFLINNKKKITSSLVKNYSGYRNASFSGLSFNLMHNLEPEEKHIELYHYQRDYFIVDSDSEDIIKKNVTDNINDVNYGKFNVDYIISNDYFKYSEIYSNGYELIWLYLISIGSLLCGIFVITTKNPVLAVLYLIALFLHISGYLFLIGISFIGLSYLLVYIGAVSILFLFILMLINVRISELQSNSSNGLFLSFIVGISFYSSVVSILPIKLNLKRNIY